MKWVAVGLVATLAVACVKEIPLPADQAAFTSHLQNLRDRHAKAKKTNNDLKVSAIESEARRLFAAPPKVEAWVGTVGGVNSFAGAKWVSIEAGGVVFQIRPQNDRVRERLNRFAKGDWVQFSGDVTVETNLTMGQAIRSTELIVSAFEIEPYWNDQIGGTSR